MRQSEQINELAAALAKAQGSFTNPVRNREVRVRVPAKDVEYTFKYATFDAILDAVRKPLSDNGLALAQGVAFNEHGVVLTTKLLHATGQWLESDTPVFYSEDKAQAFGSGVSYAKRYAVASLLGVTADEDDDGNNADGNRAKFKDRKPGPKSVERGTPIADARREIDAGTASTVPQDKPATVAKLTAEANPKEWAISLTAHNWLQGEAKATLLSINNAPEIGQWQSDYKVEIAALDRYEPKRHRWLMNLINEQLDNARDYRAAG